jgi:hypothetical protein
MACSRVNFAFYLYDISYAYQQKQMQVLDSFEFLISLTMVQLELKHAA